ncbi:MAG: diphosphomevalonate decarboxylase [Deltaproteobacteria bacterium]|nr:diphosphomevalonate decarboxylase [Deltaproteobacteria bacterium]
MKVTVVAPSNIAFIKYWGTRDEESTLPYNPSISMTLSTCISRCTVEHLPGTDSVEVLWRRRGELAPAPANFASGVERHLARLRESFGVPGGFRVAAENSFPTAAGMASSASGFAALTLATAGALGRELESAEASILARRSGSGSAARSVLGGYVEWPSQSGSEEAEQIAPAADWPLSNVVAVVSSEPKAISSREGHRRAPGSPLFDGRMQAIPDRLRTVRQAIEERNISLLGPTIEEEAIELHMIAMSSSPPIVYWTAGTLSVLRHVRALRDAGLSAYATIDAGPNVHVICPSEEEANVARALGQLDDVETVIRDRVGPGPYVTENHVA